MYMDKKQYSLAEFRKCTREAFNLADSDIDVCIERYGKKYILITESYYQKLLKPAANSAAIPLATKENVLAGAPIIIKTPEQAKKAVEIDTKGKNIHRNWCPNGHSIPVGRSKCLGKGCKYS